MQVAKGGEFSMEQQILDAPKTGVLIKGATLTSAELATSELKEPAKDALGVAEATRGLGTELPHEAIRFLESARVRKLATLLASLLIYAGLVVGYFLLVLKHLGDILVRAFHESLLVYAPLALVLIIVQGAVLEHVTSLIAEWLGLRNME